MGKPLSERTRAALEPSARLKDVQSVLSENEAALEQLKADMLAAETAELDPALASEEARAARDRAADMRFEAARTEAAIQQLRDRVRIMQADEAEGLRRRQYDDARAAGDALVEDLRTRGAKALATLADLAGRISAHDALIAEINRQLPRHADRLVSPEVIARGALNESYWSPGEPMLRITAMTLPFFDAPGSAWPRRTEMAQLDAAMQTDARRMITARSEAKEPPKPPPQFELTQQPYRGTMVTGVRHADGVIGVDNRPVIVRMLPHQVKAAEDRGLKVRRLAEQPAQATA